MRNWSEYQQNVFAFVANNSSSVVINAVAGSGKTTTIVECAKRESAKGKSILFLAFNKSIATELATKMQGTNIECKTLHSHGFRGLAKAIGGNVTTDNNKWRKYVTNNLYGLTDATFNDKREEYAFISNCVTLLNLCRINLVQSGDMKAINAIAQHHGIDCIWDEPKVVNTILADAYNVTEIIDFTDMITAPCTNDTARRNTPKYDIVFVDECQDLSKAQRELVLCSLAKGGKFVAVGDPKQAINGFCGADCNSFYELVKLANNNELPLSVCYRCGKDIIAQAQALVPNIKAFEGAANGIVRHTTELAEIQRGDMVICRKSAPLVGLCLKMIANGISAKVKGTDIAEGLKKLIEKMKAKNIHYLYDKLDNELENIRKRAERQGITNTDNCPSVLAFKDKIECIRVIAETCTSIAQVVAKLDNLFSDYKSNNMVMLSTIHKAKGLEADNVFIIVPNKLPLTFKGQQEWELEQEYNLKYVAITRAKKVLTFVDLDEDSIAEYQF